MVAAALAGGCDVPFVDAPDNCNCPQPGGYCVDGTCRCTDGLTLCNVSPPDQYSEYDYETIDQYEDRALGWACVPLGTESHCGSCNNRCAIGGTCLNRACVCPTGQTVCDGMCVDLNTNSDYCGQCEQSCGESPCENGLCECESSDYECNNLNCEGNCPQGGRCSGGECVCPDGQTHCTEGYYRNNCVDLQNNQLACGECTIRCDGHSSCLEGSCGCEDEDSSYCPSVGCVDLDIDPLNCFECGYACPPEITCDLGVCDCPDALVACDQECVDTSTSWIHCGNCGQPCPEEADCQGGHCICPELQSFCGEQCVDVDLSFDHCGDCDNPCEANQLCAGGACHSVLTLALSENASCALISDGSVRCWGEVIHPEVNDGIPLSTALPIVIPGIDEATLLEAGASTTCVLNDDDVLCWGEDPIESASGFGEAELLAVGDGHICVLEDSTVWCWGENDSGQLGIGSVVSSGIPSEVALDDVDRIVAWGQHTCALLDNGSVACWGRNNSEQTGNTSESDVLTPTIVSGLEGVQRIAVGGFHSCALLEDGSVACWGDNSSFQLGDESAAGGASPSPVADLADGSDVAVGWMHSCALMDDTTVQCWGANELGQLGDSLSTFETRGQSMPVFGLTSVTALSIGGEHSCALREDGLVLCWGSNLDGQLGSGELLTVQDRAVVVIWE